MGDVRVALFGVGSARVGAASAVPHQPLSGADWRRQPVVGCTVSPGGYVHDGLQFIAAECQLTFRWTTVPVCDSLA